MFDLVIQRGNGDRDNKEHRGDKLKGKKFNVVLLLATTNFLNFVFTISFNLNTFYLCAYSLKRVLPTLVYLILLIIKEFSQVTYLMCCCVYFPDGQNPNIIPFLSL